MKGFHFSLCKCFVNLYHKHVVYSFLETEEYFEKCIELLRAGMSKNYFTGILFPQYLRGDALHHHLKRASLLILQTQSMKQYFLFVQTAPLPALWTPALSVLSHWLVLSSVQAVPERTAHMEIIKKLLKIDTIVTFSTNLSPFNTQKFISSISAFKLLWNRII